MSDDTVTITAKRYAYLEKVAKELRALKAWGVDNWEGYGEAMRELYGNDDDEDEEEDNG